MMFLQRFSSAGNSVLDTPLNKQRKAKQIQVNYFDIHIIQATTFQWSHLKNTGYVVICHNIVLASYS